MKTLSTLAFGLLFSTGAFAAENPLVGTWNLEGVYRDVNGAREPSAAYGAKPEGSIIFTSEGRLMIIVTSTRTAETAGDMAKTFLAFTGPYRVIGPGKMVYQLDATVNGSPKGVDRERLVDLKGDSLALTVLPGNKLPDGTVAHTIQAWTRGK